MIRKKYAPPEESKVERLRRLDAGVTKKAAACAITAGIVGALILGFGMSLAMTELAALLGLYGGLGMAVGIPVGLVGLVIVGFARPLYSRILQKERKRIAPQILQLTDELLKK